MEAFLRAWIALACLVCLAAPASAEDPARADALSSENGRYSMTPTADGFLRLDTRTGAVSLCKIENGAARCQAAADERAALKDEIERLARQNDALKSKPPVAGLPSRQDFDRALDYAEHFMRRMMKFIREQDPSDRT
jgi:hypothetical protein